jgi:hypothetical protein
VGWVTGEGSYLAMGYALWATPFTDQQAARPLAD